MKEELSILNAIIRLPRMCSEFHKALRNKASNEILKATENRSIENLSRMMQGKKVSDFMESIQEKLDNRKNMSNSPKLRENEKLEPTQSTIEDLEEMKQLNQSFDTKIDCMSPK